MGLRKLCSGHGSAYAGQLAAAWARAALPDTEMQRRDKPLQSRLLLCDTDAIRRRSQEQRNRRKRRDGGTGRRSGLKIRRGQPRGGSTPPPGTTQSSRSSLELAFGREDIAALPLSTRGIGQLQRACMAGGVVDQRKGHVHTSARQAYLLAQGRADPLG